MAVLRRWAAKVAPIPPPHAPASRAAEVAMLRSQQERIQRRLLELDAEVQARRYRGFT